MQFAKQFGGLVIGRDTFAISWGGFFLGVGWLFYRLGCHKEGESAAKPR